MCVCWGCVGVFTVEYSCMFQALRADPFNKMFKVCAVVMCAFLQLLASCNPIANAAACSVLTVVWSGTLVSR